MKYNFFTLFFLAGFFWCTTVQAQKIYIRALGKASDNSTLFKGGSLVIGHENEIEAANFSETDSSCGFMPGGGNCRTSTGAWVFSMDINPSVIDFKTYMYPGKKIGKVTVTFEKEGSNPFNYYTVVMENVYVKMISESAGYLTPRFYIELDPSTIQWTFIEQKPDGTPGKKTSYGWDRTKNGPL